MTSCGETEIRPKGEAKRLLDSLVKLTTYAEELEREIEVLKGKLSKYE